MTRRQALSPTLPVRHEDGIDTADIAAVTWTAISIVDTTAIATTTAPNSSAKSTKTATLSSAPARAHLSETSYSPAWEPRRGYCWAG
jgi:hypothetical protein